MGKIKLLLALSIYITLIGCASGMHHYFGSAENAIARSDWEAAYRLIEDYLVSGNPEFSSRAQSILANNPQMKEAAEKTFSITSLEESKSQYGTNALGIEEKRLNIFSKISTEQSVILAKNNFSIVFKDDLERKSIKEEEDRKRSETKQIKIEKLKSNRCIKKVFSKYCLGMDEGDLLNISGIEKGEDRGYSTLYLLTDKNRDTILFSAFSKRVYRIMRSYEDPSWITYISLKKRLEQKYGNPKDYSIFPDYADSLSSRETAISLGKGRALHVWTNDGWSIRLGWNTRKAILLIYQFDHLAEESSKSRDNSDL